MRAPVARRLWSAHRGKAVALAAVAALLGVWVVGRGRPSPPPMGGGASPARAPPRGDPPTLTVADRGLAAVPAAVDRDTTPLPTATGNCDRAMCRGLRRRGQPVSGQRAQRVLPGARLTRPQRTKLIFWHISKCGGTSICKQGQKNGERVQQCHCHPPEAQVWYIQNGTREDQERALEQVFVDAADENTFVMPEEKMPPAGFAPAMDVYSFITLREPKARMVSQYGQKLGMNTIHARKYHEAPADAPVTEPYNSFLKKVAAAQGLDRVPTLEEYLKFLRANNGGDYMVRYLLGVSKDKMIGPPGRPVTAADLEAAKAVLRDAMDFVLVLERLDEAGCLIEQLGWDPELPHENTADAFTIRLRGEKDELELEQPAAVVEAAEAADPTERTEAVEALLDELNVFDPELYAYAVELFEAHLARCACCEAARDG